LKKNERRELDILFHCIVCIRPPPQERKDENVFLDEELNELRNRLKYPISAQLNTRLGVFGDFLSSSPTTFKEKKGGKNEQRDKGG